MSISYVSECLWWILGRTPFLLRDSYNCFSSMSVYGVATRWGKLFFACTNFQLVFVFRYNFTSMMETLLEIPF